MGNAVTEFRRVFALVLGLSQSACAARPPAPNGTVVVEVPAAVAVARPAPPPPLRRAPCRERAALLHAQNEDDELDTRAGYTGHWYTYADTSGSHVVPWPPNVPGGGFSMSPGGVESPYAAHMLGELTNGDIVFAGMGANFFDPKRAFDASEFAGVEFWIKVGADSTRSVRLLFADKNTDPDGGVCSECFNHFGVDLKGGVEWRQLRVAFSQLEQLPGWGVPRPARVDTTALYGFQLQVVEPGSAFDVWIDALRFSGCPDSEN